MPNFTLQSPSDVSRSGSDKTWTTVASVLGSGGFSSSGTYLPGDKADFILINVAGPMPALIALPATVVLSLNGYETSGTTTPTPIADDAIGLGLLTGGILTANAAQTMAYGYSPGVRTWTISTVGITLAQLNAGSVYLYLGFSALPTVSTAFNSGNWSISYSGAGNLTINGTQTPWAGAPPYSHTELDFFVTPRTVSESGTLTATATWTGGGTAPSYVPLTITSPVSSSSGVSAESLPPSSVCSAIVTDLFGNTGSTTGNTPQSESLSHSLKVLVALSGSTGVYSSAVSASGAATYSPSGTGGANASVGISAVVGNPDATTIYLNQASLTYTTSSSGTHPSPPPAISPHTLSTKMWIWPPYSVRIK